MANEKFSDFDPGDVAISVGISQGGDNVKETLPKVYVALLTQTGTDAPVATVLKNTLGGTVVWSYAAVGTYNATLAGVFTVNKTAIFHGNCNGIIIISASRIDSDQLEISTFVEDGGTGIFANGDAILSNTPFEIRVYP